MYEGEVILERKPHIDATGAVLLLIIMLALGLNQVGIKIVNEGLAPVFQAGLRSLAAAPLIFIYCLFRGSKIDTSRPVFIAGVLTGLAFALEFALLFQALQWTSVARASIFFYTMPFWVALAAHFLIPGEKLTPIRIIGLAMAIAGVVIALSDRQATAGPNAFLGDILALLAATGWALIAIVARTTAFSTLKADAQLFYQTAVSAVILLPLAFLLGDTWREPTTLHWLIFSAQVLFVVCTCFMLWFWILSIYPASDMASFSFLAPVFGVIFGWLILNESLNWTIAIALILVAIGIVLINRR